MYFDICYLVMYPILYLENISVKERHAPPLPQMVEMIFFGGFFFLGGGGVSLTGNSGRECICAMLIHLGC